MSPKFPHPWLTHSKPSRAASSRAVFYATDQHTLQRRHNECDSVSDHQPHDCLLNRLFGRRSKKTSKLRVTGLCEGKSPGTGEFPAQIASNAENVSIGWRHHVRGRRSIKSWQRTSILWITPVYLGLVHSGWTTVTKSMLYAGILTRLETTMYIGTSQVYHCIFN